MAQAPKARRDDAVLFVCQPLAAYPLLQGARCPQGKRFLIGGIAHFLAYRPNCDVQ
jgi:hypothetical protein